ncbi:PGPGW domain-containing protein [Kroppenstedtia sanguinis]|uniref:PGPGW domain-containing protein n=1 Tax=Kroppenstedtia sanguinis TaxID=1380684 RepID=A0ABW4CCB5_9BACL
MAKPHIIPYFILSLLRLNQRLKSRYNTPDTTPRERERIPLNKRNIKRLAGQIIGWFFIVLGILGLVLPFLQGILFILIGLMILSKTSPWAHRLVVKLETRYPRIGKQLSKWKKYPVLKRILP